MPLRWESLVMRSEKSASTQANIAKTHPSNAVFSPRLSSHPPVLAKMVAWQPKIRAEPLIASLTVSVQFASKLSAVFRLNLKVSQSSLASASIKSSARTRDHTVHPPSALDHDSLPPKRQKRKKKNTFIVHLMTLLRLKVLIILFDMC